MPLVGVEKFNKEFNDFAKRLLPNEVLLVQKKLALEALRLLVLTTPVDTGRARGGWIVSINEPSDEVKDRTDKSGSGTISEGTSAILQMQKLFSTVFITNNVHYIVYLNQGTSKQAPGNFVENVFETLAEAFE